MSRSVMFGSLRHQILLWWQKEICGSFPLYIRAFPKFLIADILPWYLVTMILLRGIQNVPGIQVACMKWAIMDDFQKNKKILELKSNLKIYYWHFFQGFQSF